MKNIFRPLFFVLIVAGLLSSTSCKKSSPSIIGTWTFNNVVSNSVNKQNNGGTTTTITEGITYSAPVTTVTQTIDTSGSGGGSISVDLNAYSLVVTINTDGTYLIKESYSYNGASASTSTTGTWVYGSNNSPNDNISFSNKGSVLLNGATFNSGSGNNTFGLYGNFFTISSLSSNQLILSLNTTNTLSASGGNSVTQSASATVTFGR